MEISLDEKMSVKKQWVEIRPGIIRTEMTAPVKEKYDQLIANGLVPQRRWGFPENAGKAVAALAKGYFPTPPVWSSRSAAE
jgi:NAD(P)-dependent dehydrogenase (short-subunit alcohol dehydrogenase family)